jgi:multidrug resistance efflux pump
MVAGLRKIVVLVLVALLLAGAGVGLLVWAGSLLLASQEPATTRVPEVDEVACLGYVDAEHGVAALDSLRPARVEAVLVQENQHVAAGTVLVRLEDQLARSRLEEARAALEIAQLILEQARRRPEEHRLRLSQQTAALQAAQDRLTGAEQQCRYHRRLSDNQLQAQEFSAQAEALVAQLQALTQVERDRLNELKLQGPLQELQRAQAAVRLQLSRVQQAEAELKELSITAPRAGIVLRVLAGPGDLVGGPGHKAVLHFCPEGPRLVRVELEQDLAGRIRPGQPATIHDDSAAGVSWRGQVRRVADWYGPQRLVLHEPRSEREVRTVECVIEVEDGPCPLRIGQRVRVRIGVAPQTPE